MAPSELTWVNGAVDYWYHNDTPGIVWLQRLRDDLPGHHLAQPAAAAPGGTSVKSVRMIREMFPMFELTLEGLDDGIKFLIQGKTALHQTG